MEIRQVEENPYREFEREWELADRAMGMVWDRQTFYFELFEGEEPAGYFLVVINGGVAELKDVLVLEKFRGRGFGTSIVERFVAFASGRRCHKGIIVTSESHGAARALYEKSGFAVENVMEDDRYHRTWYRYSKPLDAPRARKRH